MTIEFADREQSERVRRLFRWAQSRAAQSVAPGKFMNDFEDEMKALFIKSEEEVLAARVVWDDPTHVAADIEALCAYRALRHWGTDWGLCR